jgi:hypothetical protein
MFVVPWVYVSYIPRQVSLLDQSKVVKPAYFQRVNEIIKISDLLIVTKTLLLFYSIFALLFSLGLDSIRAEQLTGQQLSEFQACRFQWVSGQCTALERLGG